MPSSTRWYTGWPSVAGPCSGATPHDADAPGRGLFAPLERGVDFLGETGVGPGKRDPVPGEVVREGGVGFCQRLALPGFGDVGVLPAVLRHPRHDRGADVGWQALIVRGRDERAAAVFVVVQPARHYRALLGRQLRRHRQRRPRHLRYPGVEPQRLRGKRSRRPGRSAHGAVGRRRRRGRRRHSAAAAWCDRASGRGGRCDRGNGTRCARSGAAWRSYAGGGGRIAGAVADGKPQLRALFGALLLQLLLRLELALFPAPLRAQLMAFVGGFPHVVEQADGVAADRGARQFSSVLLAGLEFGHPVFVAGRGFVPPSGGRVLPQPHDAVGEHEAQQQKHGFSFRAKRGRTGALRRS